jgi:osmotically-inducible protein OsmY
MSKCHLGLDYSSGDWRLLGYEGSGAADRRRADRTVTTDICARIATHDALDPIDVLVRTQHGVVMLTGVVDTRHDRRLAEQLVREVAGVKDVLNHLGTRTQYE